MTITHIGAALEKYFQNICGAVHVFLLPSLFLSDDAETPVWWE